MSIEGRIGKRFSVQRFAGGFVLAVLAGIVGYGLLAGFVIFDRRVHLVGLGVAALLGVPLGIGVMAMAWIPTCIACARDLASKRFAFAPDDRTLEAAIATGNVATVTAGLRKGKPITLDEQRKSKIRAAFADLDWCPGCLALARVRFRGKSCGFVDADARTICRDLAA